MSNLFAPQRVGPVVRKQGWRRAIIQSSCFLSCFRPDLREKMDDFKTTTSVGRKRLGRI